MKIEQLYKLYYESEGVSTDTRNISEGQLFFALKGPSYNANRFAQQALDKGALYAIIDEEEYKVNEQFILVEDVLVTLQDLAKHHRSQLDIPFIGVVGSNGKTTTKELLQAILGTQFKTGVTRGNLNNEIGVPLTLLSFAKDTEIAIIEMGARFKGDIEFLCKIANPSHGIITNAGKDHMETFKSLENVIKTNAELFEHLKIHQGTAFVKKEYDYLLKEAEGIKDVIYYGESLEIDCRGELLSSFPGVRFQYNWKEDECQAQSNLPGQYNFENLLAAVCIGKYFGISDVNIQSAISSYSPKNNRSQIVKQGSNTYVMDAYNANPTSMKGALDSFAEVPSRHKVIIMGDMLELGEQSQKEHLEMLRYAMEKKFDEIILVGDEFGKVKGNARAFHFTSTAQLKQWLMSQQFTNTYFLVKGSRGIALEKAFDF